MTNEEPTIRRSLHSNLGRDFGFQYPYHRWVAALALLAGAAAGVYTLIVGDGLLAALGRGFNAGAAAFVAWGLAREIDLPRQWTGLVAGALGGLAAILWGPIPILAAGFLFLPLRLVNHAAGLRSNSGDSWAVAVFGLLVMVITGEWLLGAASTLALLLDGWLDSEGRGRPWLPAALAAAGTLIYLLITGWPSLATPDATALAIVGVAALFGLVRLARQRDQGSDDRGRPVDYRRALWAAALALFVATASLFTSGGLLAFSPLWAALLGAGF